MLQCKAVSNCISTSSVNSVDKYSSPWVFEDDIESDFQKLTKILEDDKYLKLIELIPDKLYLRAEAKSAVPPTGTDDIEILINPLDKIITYRSNSREVNQLPTTLQPVGDGGSN